MDNKLIIFLIAVLGILMCTAPIMASENSQNKLDVSDLVIEKLFYEHTDANGNVDSNTSYYFQFKVNGSDIGENVANITTYDKNNKTIETFNYTISSTDDYNLSLKSGEIDHASVVIKNGSDSVVFNKTISKIKKTDDITKDEPAEKKSESSQTYWASANSNKFHYPSCEWAQKISGKNKVVFSSRDEAISSGYQPCQVCSP